MKAVKTDIVAIFHDESIFRANAYQKFCRLGNNEQVLKPKSARRGLLMYELVCLFYGKMVDPDTGKYCHVIIKYGKKYYGYWKGEDVVSHT